MLRPFITAMLLLAALSVLGRQVDGVTSPAASTTSIAAAEFKCADHECGCADAESCRRSCCCHRTSGAIEDPETRRETRVNLLEPAQMVHAGSIDRESLLSARMCPMHCGGRGGLGLAFGPSFEFVIAKETPIVERVPAEVRSGKNESFDRILGVRPQPPSPPPKRA